MAAGWLAAFAAGAAVSLAASWLLVSRLDRVERVQPGRAARAGRGGRRANVVSAVYLAVRGRGAAVLSTALNSNAVNVIAGLLIPAAITGLGAASGQDILVAAWYAGLTVLALGLAYRGHGVGRLSGAVIIAGYLAFVAALGVTA